MLTDELMNCARSAGFSAADIDKLDQELLVFATLVNKHRTDRLLEFFEAYSKDQLFACAEACREIDQSIAAELLSERAALFIANADEIMAHHLRSSV